MDETSVARDQGGAEAICHMASSCGEVTATVHTAGRPPAVGRVLARTAEIDALRSRAAATLRSAVADPTLAMLAEATEALLADVYDLLSEPLVELFEPFARVGLRLEEGRLTSLPIETAHRGTEPALFERAQVYRLTGGRGPVTGSRGPCRTEPLRPRRFHLSFDEGAPTDLDVVALEQNLIRWVSLIAGERASQTATEPLIHVAGHDPIIPTAVVDPRDRAHVVLSGCSSLPSSLPPGVASALGTLWAVDNRSSSSMMTAYHARLAIGIGPVEALRQAQLLHRHQPPMAWAAYAHIGAPV